MMVELFVDRAKPRLPYVIPNTNIIVSAVYIEPATRGEEPGWSDWTSENSLFYKFKYTIPMPKVREPTRIVFLIPKTKKITLEEFSSRIEKTRFLHATVKWATSPIYKKIELENENPGDIIYELMKVLEPEESALLLEELARRGTSFHDFLLEIIINSQKTLKTVIKKIYESEKWKLVKEYTQKLEFYDYYHILPFSITITIKRELDHMLVPLNYALQAICSVLKPEIKCKNSTNIERYVDLVEIFNNLINYAEDKLREDHVERINTIIKYYNLMR